MSFHGKTRRPKKLSRQAFVPHARKNGVSVSAPENARNKLIFVEFDNIWLWEG